MPTQQQEVADYLRKHDMEATLNKLINQLCVERPEDVDTWLIDHLNALSTATTKTKAPPKASK